MKAEYFYAYVDEGMIDGWYFVYKGIKLDFDEVNVALFRHEKDAREYCEWRNFSSN